MLDVILLKVSTVEFELTTEIKLCSSHRKRLKRQFVAMQPF